MVNYSDVKRLPNWSKRHLIKIETGCYNGPQVEIEVIFLENRDVSFRNIELEDFIALIESSRVYYKMDWLNEKGESIRTTMDKNTTLKGELFSLPKVVRDGVFEYFGEVYKNERKAAEPPTFEKLADKYNTYQELAEDLINELYKNKRDINWKEVAQFLFDKANAVGLL